MLKKRAAVVVTSCLLAGLLTIGSGAIAQAAECLSGPNAQSGPGTHWRYRIKHSTGQRCWYLKRLGQVARSRPVAESAAAARTPRSSAPEPAPPPEPATEKSSSIRAWFSSTFAAFTALGKSVTNTETNEASTNDNSAASKQPNGERTEQKKSQQSKAEQQSKSSQSKQDKSDAARTLSRAAPLLLEAAGDKLLPDATAELTVEEQKIAIEAIGDKDVAIPQVITPQTQLEQDWQKELYEQFLEWRVKKLMFM
jgi:hypothetical protein